MATRTAKKVISTATREEAEQAMATVAKCNSKLKSIEAKMELEKQKVEEKYREQIQSIKDDLAEPSEVIEVWAKADCKNWEGKSIDLAHGTAGFRTNPPKLEKDKKFKWDDVTALLKKFFPDLVRTKDEPNKELIIGMRDEKEFERISEKCHITVVQDETFFIKTNEEELAA